jgi:hypothetical protein
VSLVALTGIVADPPLTPPRRGFIKPWRTFSGAARVPLLGGVRGGFFERWGFDVPRWVFSPTVSPFLVVLFLSTVIRAADVSARLELPSEGTHVIGDPIPLVWHFTNSTPKPLAFVWEACCRLNGRLDIRHDGQAMPTTPPGPGTAHQFAKPAIIGPTGEQQFESMLADWAFLTNSGRYEITGRYVGVVEGQRPPVPASIALWRDLAVTPPTTIALLTVPDYLAQRQQRSLDRGLEATVTGPDALPPVGPATFEVRIHNASPGPLSLHWPLDGDLWLVDHAGLRIFRSPTKPDVAAKELTIGPGATVTEAFPVSVDDLNSAPLGDYGVFIDFPERDGKPRVPSTLHPVTWNPGTGEVTGLLGAAADGRLVGARNAPLRRLRQYLASLSPQLSQIPTNDLSAKAVRLRHDLLLADCLADLPTRTGRATLQAEALPGGDWRFTEPAVLRCAQGSPAEQLTAVTSVRRHLGLEIAINLHPLPATTVADLINAARAIEAASDDLATAPRFITDAPTNVVAGTISFPKEVPKAELRFRIADGKATFWNAAEPARQFAAVADLASTMESVRSTAQTLVQCDSKLVWAELEPWLRPLLQRGFQIDLAAAGPDQKAQ